MNLMTRNQSSVLERTTRPGDDASFPIIIDDEPETRPSKGPFEEAPVDSKLLKHIDLTGDEGDNIQLEPTAYLLKDRFHGGVQLELSLVFGSVPPGVDLHDILRMLSIKGFTSSMVQKIVFYRNSTVVAQFSHPQIRDAALAILSNLRDPFSTKGHSGVLTVFAPSSNTRPPSLHDDGDDDIEIMSVDPPRILQTTGDHRDHIDIDSYPREYDSGSDATWGSCSEPRVQRRRESEGPKEIRLTANQAANNACPVLTQPVATTVLPRKTTSTQVHSSSTANFEYVELPKSAYNKPRRVLVSPDIGLITTVSMRCDAQFVTLGGSTRHRISKWSLPSLDSDRVEDACLVGNTIVVGYGTGRSPLTLIPLTKGERPGMVTVNNARDKITSIGRVIPAGPCAFITSSGPEHAVYHWSLRDIIVTPELLAGVPKRPQALAYKSHKLRLGVGKSFQTMDIEHLAQKPSSIPLNSSVFQIHEPVKDFCITEVEHTSEQVLIFDLKRNQRDPIFRLGREYEGKALSQYNRGDTRLVWFTKGYPDGSVVVWDFRKANIPLVNVRRTDSDKVAHMAFISDTEVVAYGSQMLTFHSFV